MPLRDTLFRWPVLRQIRGGDLHALGETARSPRCETLKPRTEKADKVVRSVYPYCAVGCGQLVYMKDGRITDIEGDPKAMTAASLVLSLLPGRSRARRAASGLIGTVGALTLRFAVFHAGKASARDPKATFRPQRKRLEEQSSC